MSLLKEKVNRILIKIQLGEEDAFKELHTVTYNHLKLIAFTYLSNRDDVEDVVNEAYYKVCKYIRSVDINNDGYNWMCKIVQNLCYDFNRKRAINNYIEKVSQNGLFYEVENVLLERGQLYQVIEKLDLPDQELIYFRYWEGLSLGEIAKRKDMKRSTVHKRIKALLKRIYKELDIK